MNSYWGKHAHILKSVDTIPTHLKSHRRCMNPQWLLECDAIKNMMEMSYIYSIDVKIYIIQCWGVKKISSSQQMLWYYYDRNCTSYHRILRYNSWCIFVLALSPILLKCDQLMESSSWWAIFNETTFIERIKFMGKKNHIKNT